MKAAVNDSLTPRLPQITELYDTGLGGGPGSIGLKVCDCGSSRCWTASRVSRAAVDSAPCCCLRTPTAQAIAESPLLGLQMRKPRKKVCTVQEGQP
jgi:hypothetical protein